MNSDLVAQRPISRRALMFVVLAIGFLPAIVLSFAIFLGWYRPTPPSELRLVSRLIYKAAVLAALYFALRYQGRRLKEVGFSIEPTLVEIGRAGALLIASYFLTVAYWGVVAFISQAYLTQRNYDPVALFGTEGSVAAVLLVFLNPFHEELVVRAFLITEMEAIYRSTWLAAIVSVVVQTSYHFYQGFVPALSHVPVFLLFSIYYVRSRRIMPVILAHLVMDLLYLAVYAKHYW